MDAKSGVLPLAVSVDIGEIVIQDPDQANEYRRWVIVAMMGGSLFYISDGPLGMAKGDIKAGDQICALYGGRMPFVLRRDETGNY